MIDRPVVKDILPPRTQENNENPWFRITVTNLECSNRIANRQLAWRQTPAPRELDGRLTLADSRLYLLVEDTVLMAGQSKNNGRSHY